MRNFLPLGVFTIATSLGTAWVHLHVDEENVDHAAAANESVNTVRRPILLDARGSLGEREELRFSVRRCKPQMRCVPRGPMT